MQRCFRSKYYNILGQSNCDEGLHFSVFYYQKQHAVCMCEHLKLKKLNAFIHMEHFPQSHNII